MKKNVISAGAFFPIYIGLWPILYSFIKVDALNFFKGTSQLLIDPRLLFYFLFLLLFLLRAAKGISRQVLLSLLPVTVWAGAYLLSFVFNVDHKSDYEQFLNGFCLFSVLYAYVSVYQDSINWNNVVIAYSLSFIFITLLGFYSFFIRFGGGMNLLSNSLSQQLWRFCGGKTQYIPSALILYALFFWYKDKRKSNAVLTVAVLLSLISISLSGQRTAIVVLLYFGLMFLLYEHLVPIFFTTVLLGFAAFFYQENIQRIIQATFVHKFSSMIAGGALSRIDIWTATIDVLSKKIKYAFLGVSEGGLPSAYGNGWPMPSNNPHSMFFYFWASTGLLGVAVLFVVIWFLGVRVYLGKKLYKIMFYWILLLSFLLGGFSFYADSNRSDFLNMGIIIVICFFRLSSYQKSRNLQFYQT